AAGNSGSTDGTNSAARFGGLIRPLGGFFAFPGDMGIAVDSLTNVYVADRAHSTILKLTPVGTTWVVTTIAGLADTSGTDDGMGSAARFYEPFGVAVDPNRNIYVADT